MPTINVEAGSVVQLQEIADVIAKSRKVVVMTGAGISTNCGIPDFRSENGLYSLIQAQYDAAAKTRLTAGEAVGADMADDIDHRPAKRRKLDAPIVRTELHLTRSFTAPTTLLQSAEDIPSSGTLPKLRRTRSSTSFISESTSVVEGPILQEITKRKLSLPSETTSSEENTPISSQTSTASTSSSNRVNLPNLKGKNLFDSIIWSDPLTTSIFYMFVSSLRQKIRNDVTSTTDTHKFIRSLRDAGRLVRNYTQNIDGLEEREGLCAELEKGAGDRMRFSQKVQKASTIIGMPGGSTYSAGVESVYLHGSLESLRCSLCARLASWDEEGRHGTTLAGEAPDCPWCTASSSQREGRGRRSLAVGRLRPDIVLYGEEHPSAHLIGPIVTHDLSLGPDVLLILGTSLRVHGLKVMVREFAKAVHQRGGKVIFVNQTKPPESIWGEVIDFHIRWDCDLWVEDLKERRNDIWLPVGMPREGTPREEKPKAPPKNPSATRPDVNNGAYCTLKIIECLGRLSGRITDAEVNAKTAVQEDLTPPHNGNQKRKRDSLPRPKAVRENKENGAYCTWSILRNIQRLSATENITVAQVASPITPTSISVAQPLQEVSVNLPGRRAESGKSQKKESELPSPPDSDDIATPPCTPRTRRTKRICRIESILSSSPIVDSKRRFNVWRDFRIEG